MFTFEISFKILYLEFLLLIIIKTAEFNGCILYFETNKMIFWIKYLQIVVIY